ncbi:uncharacterized protein N7483_011584 [Penicillium malachiteum]|uniref:uncharacterized protein n=1 Tax=Penicillium malachiteum TaxID=1324776 RepID=UPI002547760D|nr:uncharacterized protein N7483_011584 [Penicillium malachiteum]KAJ5714403.1 hypothetical protein N7483_011584 [Penicillium malachiteum]
MGSLVVDKGRLGALQDWVWESGFGANETCPLINSTFQSFPHCHQGRIPVYSALVESSAQIQEAVRFARAHNLHLVVRNTGHDGAGRSSGPDSFQIHTHRLKGITENSMPEGIATVLSWLGESVLRSGLPGDSFWEEESPSERFPIPPAFIEKLSVRGARSDVEFWRLGATTQLEALRDLNREGIVGQFELKHLAERGSMEVSLEVYNLNTTDISSNRMNVLRVALERSGLHPTFLSRSVSKLTSALRHRGDIYPDDYGILMGSVIVSNTLFNSSRGPQRIADRLSQFPMAIGDTIFTSNLGGRVTDSQGLIDTSMHPAWRSSSQLFNFVRYLPYKSVEGKITAMDDLTQVQMPILYALDPSIRASYLNLPDPNQKDAPQVYWGKNYGQLLRIKRQWDPDDLFVVRSGVGSENWDVEGLCKQGMSVLARFQTFLDALAWHFR